MIVMDSQAKIFRNKQGDIELIPYDYKSNGYRKVLNNAYKDNLMQIIFTTSIYKRIIEKAYQKGLFVTRINFMDLLDDHDFTDIKDLVTQVNASNGNKTLINILIKEIDWFANNESIDIKSIELFDRENNQKIEIYNNGVILGEIDQFEVVKTNILSVLMV